MCYANWYWQQVLKTTRRTLGLLSVISSLCPSTQGLAVPVCVPAAAALAVEDFVWGVSTAMAVMHSFLVINRGRLRAPKYSQKQQVARSEQRVNMKQNCYVTCADFVQHTLKR